MTSTKGSSKQELDQKKKEFKDQMSIALPGSWIEADLEVIDYYYPNRLNSLGYTIDRNLFICETGKSEEIQRRMQEDFGEHNFVKNFKQAQNTVQQIVSDPSDSPRTAT